MRRAGWRRIERRVRDRRRRRPPRRAACAASCACPATSRSAIARCCSRAGRAARAGSAAPATARTSARRPAICRGARARTVERDRPTTGGRVDYRVVSPGADGLREPAATLDCGNSGTSLRLVAGHRSPACRCPSVLDGDASLRRRPVARIIEPLRSMGATLHGRRRRSLPPLHRDRSHPARGRSTTRRRSPAPRSSRRSCWRRCGRTGGRRSARRSRRATTRSGCSGARRRRRRSDRRHGRGVAARSKEGARCDAIDERVPGDVSAAAFWLVAGAIHPDAELTLRDVGVNPTRRADHRPPARGWAPTSRNGRSGAPATASGGEEPLADLVGPVAAELRAIDIGADDVAAAIDEIPVLCLAAAARGGHARGSAGRASCATRSRTGSRASRPASGARRAGRRRGRRHRRSRAVAALRGAVTDSLDDHRLAMTFAVAGLVADGRDDRRSGRVSAAISYPGFFAELEGVRA